MLAETKSFHASSLAPEEPPSDFIRDIVAVDLAAQRYEQVHTRFPPEPNGYLHIGHAKAIFLNFGIARESDGLCNLRYDDTNPTREKLEYVNSILEDVIWLIGGWADDRLGLKRAGETPEDRSINGKRDFYLPAFKANSHSLLETSESLPRPNAPESGRNLEPFYTSDYFDQIYAYATELIRKGSAYVCDLSPQAMATYRGSPDKRGKDSPFRDRSENDNLTLFARMKNGEFPDGARTLRARIDMGSPNVWMRDPILYRIRHAEHHRTGRKWSIYPMYDFAHCLSDYIEGITHSICTLEFEVHRPLYDWILKQLELPRPVPRQHEFARFSLSYTVMSKRKLMQLVSDGVVSGWDDPRMPTISGLRRRGVTPGAVRKFAYKIGITKYKGVTQVEAFEHAIRQDLNEIALRRFVVLRPLKVVITNYPEDKKEEFEALNNPEDPRAGTRKIPFTRVLYIEREDFMEMPPPNYFRLRLGGEVRLKYAYIIKCDELVKDAGGTTVELRCTADLESKTGGATATRKMRVALHWVSAAHAIDAEVRLYERLFTVPEPDATGDFKSALNPHSSEFLVAKCEPDLDAAGSDFRYQFERLGYFALDRDSTAARPVFNRIVSLKNRWANFNAGAGSDAQHRSVPKPVREEQLLKRSGVSWHPPERVVPLLSDDPQWDQNPQKTGVSGANGWVSAPPAVFTDARASVSNDVTACKVAIRRGLLITGRLVRTARLREEYYTDFDDPETIIRALKSMQRRVDLLTFIQRPPDVQPRYDFHFEWEGIAALPLTSFDEWWKHQITKDTRRKVERAEKAGVVIRHVSLDDDLVRGITKIYNEAPVKRGKPNRHYGKNFATVRTEMQIDLHRSEFIGAYHEDELIGFVKLLYADRVASPVLNLAMFAHRDKMTNYALMAEVVRSSIKKQIPLVFYGIWKSRRQGMREFLESNGFKQLNVPRFYVPLTVRGAICWRLGLHKSLFSRVPDKLLVRLIAWRAKWYASRYARKSHR